MRTPLKDHRADFSDFGYNRNTPFEINRPSSPFSISTTPSSFPPLLPAKRSSWKSLSFGKFSSKTIRLSILKLDGSSFDIVVTNRATVAKVKKAVEAAFCHLPTQEDAEISWSHVWGNFCLCFENMKLFRDRDSITRFGIKNGDQLQFVRHTPMYDVAGERLEKITIDSNQTNGPIHNWIKIGNLNRSSSKRSLNENMKKFCGNNRSNSNHNHVTKEVNRSSWACRMRGLFLHQKTSSPKIGTARLGRWFPSSDDDDDDDANISCKSSASSSSYSPNPFSEFAGGFGYPTGYCIK